MLTFAPKDQHVSWWKTVNAIKLEARPLFEAVAEAEGSCSNMSDASKQNGERWLELIQSLRHMGKAIPPSILKSEEQCQRLKDGEML